MTGALFSYRTLAVQGLRWFGSFLLLFSGGYGSSLHLLSSLGDADYYYRGGVVVKIGKFEVGGTVINGDFLDGLRVQGVLL